MSERRMFRTMHHFYAADPRRRRSGEADYGCHWRVAGFPRPWRLSYIQNTGEIYAVHTELTLAYDDDLLLAYGPVFLLAFVPPDPVIDCWRDVYYRTLDRVLEGWADVAHGRVEETDTLRWVIDRLREKSGGEDSEQW